MINNIDVAIDINIPGQDDKVETLCLRLDVSNKSYKIITLTNSIILASIDILAHDIEMFKQEPNELEVPK